MDTKRWTEHKNLCLDRKPEEFVAWCDRALGYLAAERRDTRKLLLWAESQKPTNGATGEKMGAISAGVDGDICHISYVIFESLKIIMSDSLLSRARACEDGPTGHRSKDSKIPRSPAMSVSATPVGGAAVLGVTGVRGLDGRVCGICMGQSTGT